LFLFFSNRLGCAGSILITVLGSLLILWLLGLIGI
jgi:Tfp pilus assembly protein PilX